MEIRLCPECNKAFYANYDNEFSSCPFCGYVLYDRRHKDRVPVDVPFIFLRDGQRVTARAKDYSRTGVRIVYRGSPLEISSKVSLNIDSLPVSNGVAVAVWSRRISKTMSSAGFTFDAARSSVKGAKCLNPS